MAKSERTIPRFIGRPTYLADASERINSSTVKIGIDSLTGPITQRPWSHKGAWAKILVCALKGLGLESVVVLTERHTWAEFDVIILEHGMEFDGVFNLYGGANDELATRVEQFRDYAGEIISFEIPMPDVGAFVKGRSAACSERFAKLIAQADELSSKSKAIRSFDAVEPSHHLVVGDSHVLSVWEPGAELRRHDGRTLYGALRVGLKDLIVNHEVYDKITVYFGNIDVRHHICRQPNPIDAAENLAIELLGQVTGLVIYGRCVELVELLPIEDESRRIPKTGYYKGTPFYGTWEQRNSARSAFNGMLKKLIDGMKELGQKSVTLWEWPRCLLDGEKLSFDVMERPKSIHLGPEWYRTNLDSGAKILYPDVRPQVEKTETEAKSEAKHQRAPKVANIQTTRYYDDFLIYFRRALQLQRRNVQVAPWVPIEDDLMNSVSIYDTVNRRYAGFSKVLEDLHYGSMIKYREPKVEALVFTHQQWQYLHLVHRITGSGASFEKDHGYRNTIVLELADAVAKGGDIEAGKDVVLRWDRDGKAMFTSIGNQIPPFNKPTPPYTRGGIQYLCQYAPIIAMEYTRWLEDQAKEGNKIGIRAAVDHVLNFQSSLGLRRYAFVLTAWVMDTAEYFPQYVDPTSHCYYGKNCIECLELLADITGKKELGYDLIMESLCRDVEPEARKFYEDRAALGHPSSALPGTIRFALPFDVEDSCCDYVRFIENYIPDNKLGSYRHLDLKKVFNNSTILDHQKGRQRYQFPLISESSIKL